MTGVLQLYDVSVNKPMKVVPRQVWTNRPNGILYPCCAIFYPNMLYVNILHGIYRTFFPNSEDSSTLRTMSAVVVKCMFFTNCFFFTLFTCISLVEKIMNIIRQTHNA